MTPETIARALAWSFLEGPWTPRGLRARGRACFGGRPPWVGQVCASVLSTFARPPRPEDLIAFLVDKVHHPGGPIRRFSTLPSTMARRRWPVPTLDDVESVIRWLGVTQDDLAWLADLRRLERHAGDAPLRHYRYLWVPKASGGLRLIEAPKPLLRSIQRRILREILSRVPAHVAACAFRRGGSVLAFARPHVERAQVIRLDLEDFFLSITFPRVRAVFSTVGYPDAVARVLAGLCTNTVPRAVWRDAPKARADWQLGRRLACPHLPQGAPTSPALANLVAYRLDARLGGLAAGLGGSYTRYADDLAFSSPEAHARFEHAVLRVSGRVIQEEGFFVNAAKTRVMPRAQRQHLAGVVVNERPNVPRVEFDRLKATLTNCVRLGPSTQNREGVPDLRSHLQGRVAWVASLNPARGARLQALLERIDWTR